MAAAAVTQAHADIATLNARRAKERTPEPSVVVIFGASGDLTKRKLLPALFHLEQAGLAAAAVRRSRRGTPSAG